MSQGPTSYREAGEFGPWWQSDRGWSYTGQAFSDYPTICARYNLIFAWEPVSEPSPTGQSKSVVGLDASSLDMRFRLIQNEQFEILDESDDEPLIATGGDHMVFGAVGRERPFAGTGPSVFCLNLKTHSSEWAARPHVPVKLKSLYLDDRCVFACWSEAVVGLDRRNGTILWREQVAGAHSFQIGERAMCMLASAPTADVEEIRFYTLRSEGESKAQAHR